MAIQYVRSFDMRGVQQGVQLESFLHHGARRRTRIAPGKTGAIVTTNARKPADSRLDQTPVKRKISRSVNQNDRRSFVARAIEVQGITADVDQLPGRRWRGLLCEGANRAQ